MDAGRETDPALRKNLTTSERTSDRELLVTRTFDAPVRLVFEAWTTPGLFGQWWVPRSSGATLLSCEQDVRVGGGYRLAIAHPKVPAPLAFFGKYLDVVPDARLVWTNDESDDGAVTTVSFEDKQGRTLLTMHERYPTTLALDRAVEGMDEAMPETFEQLDDFLATRSAGTKPT